MPKESNEFVSNRELVLLVEQQLKKGGARYFRYQIKDIMWALACVITDQVAAGKDVKYGELGRFKPVTPVKKRMYTPVSDRWLDITTKRSCAFRPNKRMINSLNKETEE